MSGWYGVDKQRIINGDASWSGSTYMAVAIDEGLYTYDRTHASLVDVPAAARLGTPVALTGKTVNVDGEITCDPITITGLLAGMDPAEGLMIYEEAAAADASRYPLLYINEGTEGGLNIYPTGGDWTFNVPAESPYLGRF